MADEFVSQDAIDKMIAEMEFKDGTAEERDKFLASAIPPPKPASNRTLVLRVQSTQDPHFQKLTVEQPRYAIVRCKNCQLYHMVFVSDGGRADALPEHKDAFGQNCAGNRTQGEMICMAVGSSKLLLKSLNEVAIYNLTHTSQAA